MNVVKHNQSANVITLLELNISQLEIASIMDYDRKTIRSYHARWPTVPSIFLGMDAGCELWTGHKGACGCDAMLAVK